MLERTGSGGCGRQLRCLQAVEVEGNDEEDDENLPRRCTVMCPLYHLASRDSRLWVDKTRRDKIEDGV